MLISRAKNLDTRRMRNLAVLMLALLLLSSTGCDQARKDLLEWSRNNSLRRPTQMVQKKTSVGKRALRSRGCPEGLIPADDQAGHSGLCVAPDGDSNRFISYFGNGRLKTEIVHNDNILRISKFYETGKPKEVVHFRDNRKSGIWKEWYPTGDLKVRGEFRAGRKNGTFSYYHPNGKLHERGVFRDDVRSGVWSTHAKDESLESRVTWLAGTQQGNAEYFFATGSLSEHGGFLAGKKHGRWVGYHPNGNRRYSGAYHSGKKNGEWVEFTMNGQVGSRKGFAKGVEVPRTHLAGTVPFSRGDVLGARTPQSLQGRYGAHAPRKAPKPKAVKKKDSGWVSM